MKLYRRGVKQTLYIRRRVPKRYHGVEDRPFVWIALNTDSESEAQAKAAIIWEQTLAAWEAKRAGDMSEAGNLMAQAKELAARRGVRYYPASGVAKLPLHEIVERVEAIPRRRGGKLDLAEADAYLGGAPAPTLKVSAALQEYWKIAKADLLHKSKDQIRRWENPRKKAVANFIKAVGDLDIAAITTPDLFAFRSWWVERLAEEGLTANSANKDMIHLTSMIDQVARASDVPLQYATRGLAIKEKGGGIRLPWPVEFIRDKLLAPGALDGLNVEARAILLIMVNTGCRPSEIAALSGSRIRLSDPIPHIAIAAEGREIKTKHSAREIPLLGASLDGARLCPNGFPRYFDNPGLTATVNKYLRENGLAPSDQHTMYGLRHSFEDRMLAAGIDERIRRDLMGHALQRERYGQGATMAMKRDMLAKIAL